MLCRWVQGCMMSEQLASVGAIASVRPWLLEICALTGFVYTHCENIDVEPSLRRTHEPRWAADANLQSVVGIAGAPCALNKFGYHAARRGFGQWIVVIALDGGCTTIRGALAPCAGVLLFRGALAVDWF